MLRVEQAVGGEVQPPRRLHPRVLLDVLLGGLAAEIDRRPGGRIEARDGAHLALHLGQGLQVVEPCLPETAAAPTRGVGRRHGRGRRPGEADELGVLVPLGPPGP